MIHGDGGPYLDRVKVSGSEPPGCVHVPVNVSPSRLPVHVADVAGTSNEIAVPFSFSPASTWTSGRISCAMSTDAAATIAQFATHPDA